MELWDAYDARGRKTGGVLARGERIPAGLYHAVAEIAVRHRIVQEQICERFRLTKAQWDAIMAEAQRNAG